MRRPQPQKRDQSRTSELTGPIRTCLGCGAKAGKATLIRLAAVTGELTIDESGRLPGRGVYCCRKLGCFRQLVKQRKKLAWALRGREQEKPLDLVVGQGLEGVFNRIAGPEESSRIG